MPDAQNEQIKYDGVDAKFDWESSFFRQCERINNSRSLGEFRKNVDILECQLSPYIDQKYRDDLGDAMKILFERAKQLGNNGVVSKKNMPSLEWGFLKAMYQALMKVAFREKILPQKSLRNKEI